MTSFFKMSDMQGVAEIIKVLMEDVKDQRREFINLNYKLREDIIERIREMSELLNKLNEKVDALTLKKKY